MPAGIAATNLVDRAKELVKGEVEINNVAPNLIDPEAILAQMSSEEKIALLSGDDMWHTAPNRRLGVPRVRVSFGSLVGRLSRLDWWIEGL